jgi:hypothetical protein
MRERAAIVVVAVLMVAARADALVLCAKAKSGVVKEGASIKLRTACTAKEIAVDADAAGLRGPAGAAGQDGAAGSNGTNGMDGAPGLSGLEVVTADGGTIIAGLQLSSGTANCPTGKKVVAGGVAGVLIAGAFTGGGVLESRPVTGGTPEGWFGSMLASASDDWFARVYAVCATVAP